jgi:FkbM family methyltransferase
MKMLLLFQRLPRFFRRHKILKIFGLVAGPIQLIRVNREFDAYIDLRDGFARLIAIEDQFEPDFFTLARHLLPKKAPVFLDVGANFGMMSQGLWHASEGALDAHLFEPNPHLCDVIDRSIQLNKAKGLTLVNAAAMEKEGQVFLNFDLAHTGAGFVSDNSTGVPVKAMVLDDYLEAHGIRSVHLMKIDVEGNEGAVLAGSRRALLDKKIRAIYFEYCPEHIKRVGGDFTPFELLVACGYEIFEWRERTSTSMSMCSHVLRVTDPLEEGELRLTRLAKAPDVRITDLLALPAGLALPKGRHS